MRFRGVTKPHKNAGWFIHFLYTQLLAEGKSISWLAKKAGISYSELYNSWRAQRAMKLFEAELLIEVFGLRLKAAVKNSARSSKKTIDKPHNLP